MVKHIILWKLKDGLSPSEKENVTQNAKSALEGLAGEIPGLLDIQVVVRPLPSSTADFMLDSTFESAEALKGYAVHPKHVAVADEFVCPFTAVRSCMDFEI